MTVLRPAALRFPVDAGLRSGQGSNAQSPVVVVAHSDRSHVWGDRPFSEPRGAIRAYLLLKRLLLSGPRPQAIPYLFNAIPDLLDHLDALGRLEVSSQRQHHHQL